MAPAKTTTRLITEFLDLYRDQWFTPADIGRQVKLNYQTVWGACKYLGEGKVIRKRYGVKNTVQYRSKLSGPGSTPVMNRKISPTEMYGALQVFAQGHVTPKFIRSGSYKAYGQAVAGVYRAAVETAYGAAPAQGDLDHYKEALIAYRDELEGHLKGIQTILDTPNVWDSHESSQFLLDFPDMQLQQIKSLADNAMKENK